METQVQHVRDWLLQSVSRHVQVSIVVSRDRVVGGMFVIEVKALFRHGELKLSRGRARTRAQETRSVVLRFGQRGA